MFLTIVLSLYFNCILDSFHFATSVELKPNKIRIYKPASRKNLSKFLKAILKSNNGVLDQRYLAIALNESRARINVRKGDNGRACGVFQIHARYSYPSYRLKTYKQRLAWKKAPKPIKIYQECKTLSTVNYSVEVMKFYLTKMDKRNKHACHHNTGIYSKYCNQWYKKRIDIWNTYFQANNLICKLKETYNENSWNFNRQSI